MFAVAALAAAILTPAFGLNNADVIKMKKADLSDDTILLSISKEAADYDTSADGLIELKSAGVSEAIIQKIMVAQKGGGTTASATTAAAPAPVAEPVAPGPDFSAQDFPTIAPPLVTPSAGQEYFLRSTIHVEDGKYAGTNYSRGVTVPINTPVRMESMSGKEIRLKRVDTGETIKVDNVDKYTRKTTAELARLLLAAEKTPLEQLPTELAASIRNGDMRKGMTKELVLMARGYPPAHETPSTDADRWVYWSSRFVKQTVLFTNGRLSEGRGIN